MSRIKIKNRILTIDDDQVFRERFTKAFQQRGFLTEQAQNKVEALLQVNDFKPDLIVLDLMLGKESGLELIQEILAISPEARILILTGYGTISSTVEAIKLGAINYLTKPVDADTIIAAFLGEVKMDSNSQIPPLHQVEWDYIQKVINQCQGNITKASKLLGLHRRSLQRKIKKSPGTIK